MPPSTEKGDLAERILRPYDFGEPVEVGRILAYLEEYDGGSIPWFEEVTVLDHMANVALFSAQIADACNERKANSVDTHKVWLMGWLRDIGRVPWGLAVKNGLTEIVKKYGHHGYLGYHLLIESGVSEELAVIAMTHIGSGVTQEELRGVREYFDGRDIFPQRDWYAKTLGEQIVVIADKVPGWNNTALGPWNKYQSSQGAEGRIYGEYSGDQGPLWERFWSFKKAVDQAAGKDVLTLFDEGLLSSDPAAYRRLPSPKEIAAMKY